MVNYRVEKRSFPNEKKFYCRPIENTFPKTKNAVFLARKRFMVARKYFPENQKHGFPDEKKFYSRPIENTFSKIKNVVFLMRKSFFYRAKITPKNLKTRAGL